MQPIRQDDPAIGRRTTARLRWFLLTRVPTTNTRLIDVVAISIGGVVALFVCIPILIVTTIAGWAVGRLLREIGIPMDIAGLFGLAAFLGGLAVGFIVMLRLYRRLPAAIRSWVTPVDDEERDDVADVEGFTTLVAGSDAGLVAGFLVTLLRSARRVSSVVWVRLVHRGEPESGPAPLSDRVAAADAALAPGASTAAAGAGRDDDARPAE